MKPGYLLQVSLLWLITCASLFTAVYAEDPVIYDPKEVDMSAERLQRIDAWMQRSIENKDFAGGITLVARGGKIVHLSSHGSLYQEENIPMRTDAIFRLASMTKPVASIALLMLYEEGHFNLDDPILFPIRK